MKGVIYPDGFNPWGTIQDEERLLALNPHLCVNDAETILQQILQRLRSEQQGEVR
jgi:hypothetical protein